MAKCKYCQKEITWIKEGRKNVPLESDGGIHQCSERQEAMESYKKLNVDHISSEEIKRYEEAINQKIKSGAKKGR